MNTTSRIVDTHCHYNLEPLVTDWQSHWQQARAHGVSDSVVVGTTVATSRTALTLTEQDEHLAAAIGIHPNEYDLETDLSEAKQRIMDEVQELRQVLTTVDHQSTDHLHRVVAIGEVGLDYFRLPVEETQAQLVRTIQQEALTAQLRLAAEYCLPTILHVRDAATPDSPTQANAYWDCHALLRQARRQGYDQPVILHCISGPTSYVQAMLQLDAFVGVAGNVSYPSAEHLRGLIAHTPPDRLLLETDAPFLPPQPFRGQRCQPWMIAETAAFLASTLNIEIAQLAENSRFLTR